jgi:hypothetical protein
MSTERSVSPAKVVGHALQIGCHGWSDAQQARTGMAMGDCQLERCNCQFSCGIISLIAFA